MTSSMSIRFALCLSALFIAAPIAAAAEALVERRYPAPEQGEIVLLVPESWNDSRQGLPGNLPTAINFKPDPAGDFSVTITPWRNILHRDDYGTPGMLREFTEQQRALSGRRTPANPMEIRAFGDGLTGFAFAMVDPALVGQPPSPGRFSHAIQGYVMIGGLMFHVMVFAVSADSPAFEQTLEMIRSARLHP